MGIGIRRAGRADAIAGELDPVAISSDLTPSCGRYTCPGVLHATADLTFRPDILRRSGVPQPFGLPRAADGLRLAPSAHVTHWGARVHIAPPQRATPLPTPGLPSSAI